MPQPDRPLIRLRALGHHYPGPPPVRALHDVDLDIDNGDYTAVVGPSGSGKSTLLNVLGLLDRHTEGSYELDGIDTATLTEQDRNALRGRRIGFVFQAFHLLAHRTATENVALAMLYEGVAPRERYRRARAELERVGLGNRLQAAPGQLSGGQRQRVAIARACVGRPQLLLCDEPTGNLDSATASAMLDLLDELHQAGQTIVVITHDNAVAARAERTIAVADGHVTEVPR